MPGISDLLDSDMEENNFIDENSIISSASDATDDGANIESNATTKKTKKRHRVTMPKTKSRVTKPSPVPMVGKAQKKPNNNKRKLLEALDDTNIVAKIQKAEVSDVEDGMEVEGKNKPERKPGSKKPGRKPKQAQEDVATSIIEVEQTPMVARSSHAQNTTAKSAPKVTKASRPPKSKPVQDTIVSSVQIESMDTLDQVRDIDEITMQQPPLKRARTESRTRQEVGFRRRAGSASDTERGDPNLRRKLGDITRKFENIDVKYKNLKEVGIGEANANVEKLRKQCEATTEASNNLISSLKKELAQQAPLAQDARKLKNELQIRDEEIARICASQSELTSSLSAAQNEIKALQARLAAARAASVSSESQAVKPPGSAIKAARSTVLMNGDAAQATQIAQMKLDLYGDLTGLIVRSVKRSEDGDTYDCIQTGRNGTLHFKLFIDQEDAKSASFEETEFLYTPLLDADRDRDMIELMPAYLTEDITFARQNAAKFYQRVVDTLTRRTNDA